MYTFKKEERLYSEKLLKQLFNNGSSFVLYPFRISWKTSPDILNHPAQVVISVPKRNFKHAVDRNLLKRRVREAYRLNKAGLLYQYLSEQNTSILLSIHFIGKEIVPYSLIEKKLKLSMVKLVQAISEKVVE